MSASTNFNFPSHPTSRSQALQIVEGTRALQQSPLASSASNSNSKYSSSSASKYTSSSPKKNYAESTTSTTSFSSRTGLLKDKFRTSFGSSSSSPSSDSKSSSNSNTKSVSSNSKPMTSTRQQGLFLLGSQIRMGH